MKYGMKFYQENVEFIFPIEEGAKRLKFKMVLTRKSHKCCYCGNTNNTGSLMLSETVIYDGKINNVYTCTDCIDDMFEDCCIRCEKNI